MGTVTDAALRRWFLLPEERGNPGTEIDQLGQPNKSWAEGNLVRPLLHGSTYFRRLHEELCALESGDQVYFTDWRGDADERLLPDGPTIGDVLCDLARSGVEVRGLLWRSHSDHVRFNAQENQRFGTELNEAGAEVLLDQRIRRLASHHQKLFVIRHRGESERDVAFVGGIDLSHGRRDDENHQGDPQTAPMDPRYGERAPWHDAALELRGPVVGDLLRTFIERWDDGHPLDRRTPYRAIIQRLARMPRHPEKLSETFPDPPPVGPHAVQVLRTYGHKHPGYPFAPEGERSVARAYMKAFSLASRLIYVEDQYLWSGLVAKGICDALERAPDLRVIAVVPRYPDDDSRLAGPPARYGQSEALRRLQAVAPDRVGIYNLENAEGVPIYVHAKLCVVDDIWFTCGSDNFSRRSWTNDSELTCAVLDPTPATPLSSPPISTSDASIGANEPRLLPRELRLDVWTEHLGLLDDPGARSDRTLIDPIQAFERWRQCADDLDAWYASNRQGPRPPGQIRRHEPQPVSRFQSLWAKPLFRLIYDPDGRPRSLRRHNKF
ncbi:phospholipase D family protein [Kribbella deserti]|uniref:Phospholipase D family protein n=1 Tax=Kribbella deserti TaxID=1926257 RepID=A0ABV6QE30_9ACTN